MDDKLVSSANEIPGYRITKNLGIVRGITVRSRNLFANIGAGFQTLVGGRVSIYTNLCEKTRQEAFSIMLEHAEQLGANAIVAFRYDANEIMGGVTEVLAYGTAVQVEKI